MIEIIGFVGVALLLYVFVLALGWIVGMVWVIYLYGKAKAGTLNQ